jgi:type I restriction enzyme S subunit
LVDSLTYFGRQIFSEDTSTYKVVKREQFAYATNHIEEGSIGYQNLHERALISPMYTVFETNEKVDDGFLYKLLKTEFYRHIFEVNTSASIDRRGSLRWNVFSQIKIPLPTLNEQKAISEVIDTCDQEILLTKRKLEALQQQKKGLIQKLLTGQIRVKV